MIKISKHLFLLYLQILTCCRCLIPPLSADTVRSFCSLYCGTQTIERFSLHAVTQGSTRWQKNTTQCDVTILKAVLKNNEAAIHSA